MLSATGVANVCMCVLINNRHYRAIISLRKKNEPLTLGL